MGLHPSHALGIAQRAVVAGLVAAFDSLAVVEEWRGKGIASALVADTEKAVGSHEEGKFGAAVLYVTHEPELTDFYAGLGFTLSPDGVGIPTPLGFICHGPSQGFRFSVKALRTGVQMDDRTAFAFQQALASRWATAATDRTTRDPRPAWRPTTVLPGLRQDVAAQ
ncbi:DUF6207 family protein [Streptomyces sp. 3N207]|uniref:DUF6207 family protein n=1 Tax=Streptomyces sp. 3N207 TaxID=3457417 RepID=UPI003FD23CD0